jgi:electron transport complex protein RnfA
MTKYILIMLSATLVNNFVLTRFLGMCPFFGVSKKLSPSLGMGMAVIFVMTLASIAAWLLDHFLLGPFHFEYLRTISYILVIAALVQFMELFINKNSPALRSALGIYLPLITTNCIVLGVTLLNVNLRYSLMESVFHSLGAGLGFLLAMVILSGIRERLDKADVPPMLKDMPITFIVAALLSIAFLGFSGLIKL